MPGDPKLPRRANVLDSVTDALFAPVSASTADVKRWPLLVDALRANVQAWSGNLLQVVDLSVAEWIGQQQTGDLAKEIKRDAVELSGSFGIGLPASARARGR